MRRLEVVALPAAGEVTAGTDLAALLLDACREAGVTLREGDVVAVASKVVSKAEGALVALPDAGDVHAARRGLARREARRVVASASQVLVVETTHGFVCANAGIDTSNVPDGMALLLPSDPDASAAGLRDAIRDRAGVAVGVVVTDTFGRAWRMGQTDVAIGLAGIAPLRDERGGVDRGGRSLDVTVAAVADELAGAADLVRRKADGTPFVLLRGVDAVGDGTARDLIRPHGEDLFRWGGVDAVEHGLRLPDVTVFEDEPVPPAALDRALAAANARSELEVAIVPGGAAGRRGLAEDPAADAWATAPLLLVCAAPDDTPATLVRTGAALLRLRAVLAAQGFGSVLAGAEETAVPAGVVAGRPVALLAVGVAAGTDEAGP